MKKYLEKRKKAKIAVVLGMQFKISLRNFIFRALSKPTNFNRWMNVRRYRQTDVRTEGQGINRALRAYKIVPTCPSTFRTLYYLYSRLGWTYYRDAETYFQP